MGEEIVLKTSIDRFLVLAITLVNFLLTFENGRKIMYRAR
jgi:hypothetical protein